MNRVMIVDDDPDILRLVKTGLTKVGFEVTEAESAEAALAAAVAAKPDLVITDAMMPGKDGYELSRQLRRMPQTSGMPIIMLTALQGEQDALKAFRDGVDDFVTKPFSMPILRARVTALLSRAQAFQGARTAEPTPVVEAPPPPVRVATGVESLDKALGGGMPRGINILLTGETGAGKSYLARRFIAAGLAGGERCMTITLDDDPVLVRASLESLLEKPLAEYEGNGSFRLVDCYSWSRGLVKGNERFAVTGSLELNQLVSVIADAGAELGQTVTRKLGGRRVVDSVSSMFINFELASVQRFLAQLARTASSYGGVSTLFILEEGSVGAQAVNNTKYLVDAVIELKYEERYLARVVNMKWSKFSREWVSIEDQI
ncbi:MAG: response regulator [Chloroflexi bacterium]|nr:response regulator [Chloroflexota bacterium]